MARTWLSIQIELVEGRGEELWPRPGRMMVAARSHTFATLAVAIDDAFGGIKQSWIDHLTGFFLLAIFFVRRCRQRRRVAA